MKFDQQFQFHNEFYFQIIILFLKTDSFIYARSWKAMKSKIKTINEDFEFPGKTADLKMLSVIQPSSFVCFCMVMFGFPLLLFPP